MKVGKSEHGLGWGWGPGDWEMLLPGSSGPSTSVPWSIITERAAGIWFLAGTKWVSHILSCQSHCSWRHAMLFGKGRAVRYTMACQSSAFLYCSMPKCTVEMQSGQSHYRMGGKLFWSCADLLVPGQNTRICVYIYVYIISIFRNTPDFERGCVC